MQRNGNNGGCGMRAHRINSNGKFGKRAVPRSVKLAIEREVNSCEIKKAPVEMEDSVKELFDKRRTR